MHHAHLHCLVPGGGIAPDGKSLDCLPPRFFLPVRVLSRLFRGLGVQCGGPARRWTAPKHPRLHAPAYRPANCLP